MKPYYEEAGITIYHGDCREVLPSLAFDAIVSDPPYGIAHPCDFAKRGRDNLTACNDYPDVYGDSEPFNPAHLLSGPCLLFGANYFAEKLPPSSGWIVWDKLRPHDLDQSTAELAWSSFVKGIRVFLWQWHGMIRDGNEPLYHPTQKPEALWKWLLNLRWMPAGIVCDPYMGAGGLLVAAKHESRQAIGIEIEERYCEIAANRLRQGVLSLV